MSEFAEPSQLTMIQSLCKKITRITPNFTQKEKTLPPLYRQKKSSTKKKKQHFLKEKCRNPPPNTPTSPPFNLHHPGIPDRWWRSQINALLLISLSFRKLKKNHQHFFGVPHNFWKVQEKQRSKKLQDY